MRSKQREGEAGLRANYLSLADVVSQSIANIAPTGTPCLTIPLVAASAGSATWFVYTIATIGLAFIGLHVSMFARQFSVSGSIYSYVRLAKGRSWAFPVGWGLYAAYWFTAVSTLIGSGMFFKEFFQSLGVSWVPIYLVAAVESIIIWLLAYRDIKFSSKLALFLEAVSVSMIVVMSVIALFHGGSLVDQNQLSLKGSSVRGIALGMVMATFSFVGFESAATLGLESKSPHRNVPIAVMGSTMFVGVLFAFASYVEVRALGALPLANEPAPLSAMARMYHLPWLGTLTEFGAGISFFSCALASLNAASRVMFSLARDQIIGERCAWVHERNRTPHIAISITALLTLLVAIAMTWVQPMGAYGYTGTIATYGFLLSYIAIAIVGIAYVWNRKARSVVYIVSGIIGIVMMAIPTVGSVYPAPSFPYNLLPYIFMLYIAVGLAWYMRTARKKKHVWAFTDKLEAALEDIEGGDVSSGA